jgi:hypothetical protein
LTYLCGFSLMIGIVELSKGGLSAYLS